MLVVKVTVYTKSYFAIFFIPFTSELENDAVQFLFNKGKNTKQAAEIMNGVYASVQC